ncbi:MAG: YceD family protein [Gammaproteobacteria bacterium]|jgi:uncharacterized protein|nr:YceD family protein [Gammaproteobacteria bacterium]
MLPELDCVKAAKENKVIFEKLPLSRFERLAPSLADTEGEVSVEWAFSRNEAKQIQAKLDLHALLHLSCQRCNARIDFNLEASIQMQYVKTEAEAEALPLEIQPLYLNALNQIHPYEILEDDLILALPMFPMHEKKDCSLLQNQAYYATSDLEQKNTYKPFADLNKLADLKEKKSGSSTN